MPTPAHSCCDCSALHLAPQTIGWPCKHAVCCRFWQASIRISTSTHVRLADGAGECVMLLLQAALAENPQWSADTAARRPLTVPHVSYCSAEVVNSMLGAFRIGDSAAAVQQAILSGLMDAMDAAVKLVPEGLPAEECSTLPTAAQVLHFVRSLSTHAHHLACSEACASRWQRRCLASLTHVHPPCC